MSDVDILKEFLNTTLAASDDVFKKFAGIPGAVHRGTGLEQFLYIRGERENKVLLVAHADTVWDAGYDRGAVMEPDIIEQDGRIRNRNGGLGADDRAGCAILWLLKDTGHSLLVTNGEEDGQIGSRWLKENNTDIFDEINRDHQFMIQFDRKNARDFKCYGVGTDDFRSYVRNRTGYEEPNLTAFTDIVTLCRDICGVNLSIGYYDEHKKSEYLVVSEWLNTLDLCRRWLSEPVLPKYRLQAD